MAEKSGNEITSVNQTISHDPKTWARTCENLSLFIRQTKPASLDDARGVFEVIDNLEQIAQWAKLRS